MLAVLKREFRSYFTSPLGYVILAVLLLISGVYYSLLFAQGYADLTGVFGSIITIVFFIIPVLTMRCFSEEKRQKTDQLLLTSPVSIFSVVAGKFLACISYFGVFVAFLAVYNFIFYFFGAAPDLLTFLGNIVGIFLFAGSLIAIGIFISALTESQVVAAVGSFAVSFFLLLLDVVSSAVNNTYVTIVCDWISFSERYASFTEGVFDIANAVFFLSIIAIFLFLTVRVIDKRRWA